VSALSRNVEIIILGQKYVVKSDQDEAQLREVAQFVDAKLSELTRGGRSTTFSMAIIGALNIANEYYEYRRKMDDTLRQLEDKANRLMELLDKQS
jgi:cell division protein ZapA